MVLLKQEDSKFYDNAHGFVSETNSQEKYRQLTGNKFKDEYEEYDDFLDIYDSDGDLINAILEFTPGEWTVSYNSEADGFLVSMVKRPETPLQIIANAILEKERFGGISPQTTIELRKIGRK